MMHKSPEAIRELLDYDPGTGLFVWKPRARKWCKSQRSFAAFKVTNEGNRAFTSKNSDGYFTGAFLGLPVKAHQIAWAHHYGEWPESWIDHINGDRSDNRISNLRLVDGAGNARNRKRAANNTSGVTGVGWQRRIQKWTAQIKVDGRPIHLGVFASKQDAIAARQLAERKHGFHPNHGRAA